VVEEEQGSNNRDTVTQPIIVDGFGVVEHSVTESCVVEEK